MTRIKFKIKPVWHETAATMNGRAICVAQTPGNALVRLKGTRQVLDVAWGRVYLRAAQDRAQLMRLQKMNERRAKRKGAMRVV